MIWWALQKCDEKKSFFSQVKNPQNQVFFTFFSHNPWKIFEKRNGACIHDFHSKRIHKTWKTLQKRNQRFMKCMYTKTCLNSVKSVFYGFYPHFGLYHGMVFIHVVDKNSFLSLYHFASRGPNPSKSTYFSSCKIWVLVSTKKSKTKKKTSKPRNTWRRRRQQRLKGRPGCREAATRPPFQSIKPYNVKKCNISKIKMGSNSPLIWGARYTSCQDGTHSKHFLELF